MSAGTIPRTTKLARHDANSFSGILLAAGAAMLFVGTLFYARLPPELGLPAPPYARAQALADALALDPEKLALAGGFAFAGDCVLLAACVALAAGAKPIARAGWSLFAVSVAVAIVFDSMMAALLSPLAHAADPGAFLSFKAWFDFLFAAGNVPYAIGFATILWSDLQSSAPRLPRSAAFAGLAVAAAAAVSGLGAAVGAFFLPLVIGLSVTFGCVILAALGIQLAREPISAAPVVEPGVHHRG
ncbi:MAG TPA: hypothetical protein VEH77_13945 [Roseiarcus sp.]|nr:hypothetical protein [Roseiarcus sp.]